MTENVMIRPGSPDDSAPSPAEDGEATQNGALSNGFAMRGLDQRSVTFAIVGSALFFALGLFCLSLSRFDAALASVWLPNASAVAILLIARLRNEIPLFVGIVIASLCANSISGTAPGPAVVFTLANIVEIGVVTWLLRRSCNRQLDMADLSHLGRFLIYGGLVAPLASTAIASLAMGADTRAIFAGASSWFLADSMGLILTVPTVMLIADALRERVVLSHAELAEGCALITGGLMAVYVVFKQDAYPLLFLIPPITLLMTFRLGGLGTALYVPGIAVMASWMTYMGFGPVLENSSSDISKMYLIQAFIAANFLAGLPIAAILGGRARMTEQLLNGRAELALLAENVTDAVLSIDRQGVCTYASPSVCDVLGREPSDFVGHLITERSQTDASDRIASVLERLLNGDCDKDRVTYRRLPDADDGTPVFIEADCAVAFCPESGERSGVIVSARDVTERIELELLLTRSRRQAEHAARAKSEFLANMSHEIRTPMNGVLGFAELMLQSDLDEEHQRHTEMIVQSGRSMMLLLNDILDLSKIEAGQIAIDNAPLDIGATIDECAILHRPVAEQKGLILNFHSPNFCAGYCAKAGKPCDCALVHPWVETDALRLRQIILNLIANAVKFTEAGHVDISYDITGDTLSVEVSDTGIGISPARVETIFAPFTQGESDTSRRFGGTGLGLTISRKLAELLGGEISVQSEPGVGSTFCVTLPVTLIEPKTAPAVEPEVIKPADLPQSARILLVEDHDVNRMVGTEMLERCGQTVAIAQDGNEAIAMVMDSVMRDRPFDLVFMDIQMPGCDGYAATRAIRAEGIGPNVMPIIALTANAFPDDIAEAREAGMQAHLAKPLVFADLARSLQRWLPTRIVENEAGDANDRLGSDWPTDSSTGVELDREETDSTFSHSGNDSDGERVSSATAAGSIASFVKTYRASTTSSIRALPQNLSPSLIKRWNHRRSEAVEAVRAALENGFLAEDDNPPNDLDELARLVHKLAGTAAIFGEPELGDQAAAFERALRQDLSSEVREALAFELLSVADHSTDAAASGLD
ncbi:MAG: ATP-binding protein [Erythrobacter sp.]